LLVRGQEWTDLDEAEFDVIIWTLVKAVERHKEHCETCRTTAHACQGFATAVYEVRDWIFGRQLRSRMEALSTSTPI
jgi:transposase